MARARPLQESFNRIVHDVARSQLPGGSLWNVYDGIPAEIGAPLSKRGGWTYASQALTGVLAGADRTTGLIYAPFSAGSQLISCVRDDGGATNRLAQVVSSSSTTDRGALACYPAQNPAFYRNNVYIVDGTGTVAPQVYNGSANVANLGGTPPNGSRVGIYKDRVVLARSSTNLERLWFSAAGNGANWDTVNRWIDTSAEIHAMYMLRNAILIFHEGSMERITGATPPPGTDMTLGTLSDTGTRHPMSLAGTDQFCVFANPAGVYMTDGSTVSNLTEEGGISSIWTDRVRTATNPSFAGGFGRGIYWVTIRDGNSTFIDCFACHMAGRQWLRFRNVTASCFARRVAGEEELYFGDFSEARVNAMLANFFNPSAANKLDGDGTPVLLEFETPFYVAGLSNSRIHDVFPVYDIRDAASDNPTLSLSYILSPESSSYVDVVGFDGNPYPLSETTALYKTRRRIARKAHGIGLKLTQSGPSAQTRIYRIGGYVTPREASRH